MISFIKRQRPGTWISFVVAILSLISLIIYTINCSDGYFQGTYDSLITVFSVLALLTAAAAVLMAQFNFNRLAGKIYSIIADILRIGSAALLIASFMLFLEGRVEGFAYIFLSDADVLPAIQTPSNLNSAYTAIAGIVFYGVAGLLAIIGSFFGIEKKQVEA